MNRLLALLSGAFMVMGLANLATPTASADNAVVIGDGWSATVTVPDVAWTGLACQVVPYTVHIEGTVTQWYLGAVAEPVNAKKPHLEAELVGSGPGDVSATFSTSVCPTPKALGSYLVMGGVAVMSNGSEVEKLFMTYFTVGAPTPVAKVTAVKGNSKLKVDIDPNLGARNWTFQVQRREADGTWTPLKTFRTQGKKETRTVNLPAGIYRVWVSPRYGFAGGLSANEVILTR